MLWAEWYVPKIHTLKLNPTIVTVIEDRAFKKVSKSD